MRKARLGALVLAVSLMIALSWSLAFGQVVPRLDKDTLKAWLADPEVIILDVRAGGEWQNSARKIKGARREDPDKVKTWTAGLPKDKKIVLYCA